MKVLFYTLLFLTLLLPTHLLANPLERKLIHLVEQESDRPFSGVVLVAIKNVPVVAFAKGVANRETQEPMTLKHQFQIGALSQQQIAAIALQQIDMGLLALDQPINSFSEHYPESWQKVTIRQLLSHTSGIVSSAEAPVFEPGSQFRYSDFGYQLLGEVVSTAAGSSVGALTEKLYQQCQMSRSLAPVNLLNRAVQPMLARGYNETEQRSFVVAETLPLRQMASGGLISDAFDLAKWNQCLHHGQLLSDSSYQQMVSVSSGPFAGQKAIGYGYGLQMASPEGVKEYSHSGYISGYVSTMAYYPEQQMSLVILENTAWSIGDTARAFRLHDRLRNVVVAAQAE